MLASKENARKALRLFIQQRVVGGNDNEMAFIAQFIEAATKRLPRNDSFKRDRERRRGKAAAK